MKCTDELTFPNSSSALRPVDGMYANGGGAKKLFRSGTSSADTCLSELELLSP
jgi:hypothetical protein